MYKFEYYYQKLETYTKDFLDNAKDDITKENIRLKITHSINVEKNCRAIAESENFNDKDILIARLCGLFHDIGRFEQYTKYNTFKDSDSVYHGQLGVEALNDTGLLNDMPEKDKQIILHSTYNHGLLEIPEESDSEIILFSKITRDSDKTDIYRLVTEYYHKSGTRNTAIEYNLEDSAIISEKVMDNFRNRHIVRKTDLKTLNDFKAMQLSWIFDINFPYTQKIIIQNKYLEAILSSMKNSAQKKELQQIIKSYFC